MVNYSINTRNNQGVTSDGFFELNELPKKVAIVGAGYIAIELAGIFNVLGAQVTLIIRHCDFLRHFDEIIRNAIMEEYVKAGITVQCNSEIIKVENLSQTSKNLTLYCKSTDSNQPIDPISGFDELIFAVGRSANTEQLGLESSGVQLNDQGFIKVNEWQETNVDGVFAVGDICGEAMLTPGNFRTLFYY